MNRLILAVALAAGCTLASSAPAFAATRNYDCSKPGNASKAACKGAAKEAAKAAAKPAPAAKSKPAKSVAAAPKPAATKVSSTTTTRTVTQKNYDCSKPGNKNKAVCKSAAATPAKPIVKQTTVATQTRHYDCTKPGNKNKQECKVSMTSNRSTTQPTLTQRMKNAVSGTSSPTGRPAAGPASRRAAAAPASVEDRNPAGAIAQCKDGTYSHSKGRTGACSRHGGVAKWS